MTDSFLFDAVRTPFGKLGGTLAGTRPDDLAALVIGALLGRNPGVDPAVVDDVVLGNANGAGEENRNVARMAVLLTGLPVSVPGTTVNRLCGSSLDAAMIASRQVAVGDADLIIVGGVESMSRAPWVVPKPERPYPTQNAAMVSTTLGWRFVNPAMPEAWTASLGEATEQLRQRHGISRERQDAFAADSHRRAAAAWDGGLYASLVVGVPGVDLARDESIRPGSTLEKLSGLTPVFRPAMDTNDGGTITAGNASPLNDGASAALIGSPAGGERAGLTPRARIADRGAHALDPRFFGFAPVEAANQALDRAGIGWDEVGAVELNEAFAAQSIACSDAWGVDPAIVNAWGGAVAIGHPLGASGVRILGTLAERMRTDSVQWGVAAVCIGVGQGLAVVLENTGR